MGCLVGSEKKMLHNLSIVHFSTSTPDFETHSEDIEGCGKLPYHLTKKKKEIGERSKK